MTYQHVMAHPDLAKFLKAAVLVRAPAEGHGSGFLVCRFLDAERKRPIVFVITNRHVLGATESERTQADHIEVVVNVKKLAGGPPTPEVHDLPLRRGERHVLWAGHPNPDVDLAAIVCTHFFQQLLSTDPECVKVIPEEVIATDEKVTEFELGVGEDILIVGFPLGLAGVAGVQAIVRQGVVASPLGEEVLEPGIGGPVLLPGFRVDAGITPGGSGSLVVLKPAAARFRHGGIDLGQAVPPLILGIAAKAYTATLESGGVISTGLGLAMNFRAIRETINHFWETVARPLIQEASEHGLTP